MFLTVTWLTVTWLFRDPDVSKNPVMVAIDELKDQIQHGFPDVLLGSSKYLAYLFLEAVSELNYNLRDVLKARVQQGQSCFL